jgi:hypothetical protein
MSDARIGLENEKVPSWRAGTGMTRIAKKNYRILQHKFTILGFAVAAFATIAHGRTNRWRDAQLP